MVSPAGERDTARRSRERLAVASLPEDAGLLGGELGLGEYALLLQRRELPQLLEHVGAGVDRGCRRRRVLRLGVLRLGVLLLVVGGLILLRPAVGLPARDAVTDRGRGSGDDGGACHATKKSHDGSLSSGFE